MADIRAVEVRIWGHQVGALAPLQGKPGFYEFQYAPSFVRTGLELSPLQMPLQRTKRYSFTGLQTETFHGLPGLIADALPDRFGNALIDEYLVRHGMRNEDITLQRLLYVGRRAMGALEFEPASQDVRAPDAATPLEMAHLVEDARRALHGEFSKVAQDIIDVGSSAGGARAKAVIGWNPATQEIVSGQFDVPPGFEHWLLKFDGVGDDGQLGKATGFGRVEYAHYLMATAAGVSMSPCQLLEENGRAHFMTRRFDRKNNQKFHVHSLCGLQHLDFNLPYVHSYEQYFRTILEMDLGADALAQAWIRCIFNIAARNCDDHTKNLAFLMDDAGQWRLSPAYDVCFSHNPATGKWTRQHQMLVAGKAQGITRDDLLELGRRFGVNQPKALFEKVLDAVKQWPRFASEAGVAEAEVTHIAAYQELL